MRDAVRRWTTWFRANRAILEADVVHGRRPDGRDVDWLLHVAPGTATPALLAVYNPLAAPVTRRIVVDVSLAGLSGTLRVGEGDATHPVSVDERGRVMLDVQVQGRGHRFVPFRR